MAMEKPISNKAEIELSVFVAQPLRYSSNAFKSCFEKDISIRNLDEPDGEWSLYPSWLAEYNQLNSTYSGSICCSLCEGFNLAETDGLESVAQNFESLQAHLFYEIALRQWMVLYELKLKFPYEGLLDRLRVVDDEPDFYNALRNLFVITNEGDMKAAVIERLEKRACDLASQKCRTLYGIDLDSETDFDVVKSSGNMTLIYRTDSDMNDLPKRLQDTHSHAERIGNSVTPLDVSEEDFALYIFRGRFHTILANSDKEISRVMPIHFQAQLLWSYLSTMEKVLRAIEKDIVSEKTRKSLFDSDYISSVINSIQYARFLDDSFKRSIESDNELIYRHVQKQWSLGTFLQSVENFSGRVSDHIERCYQRESLLSEEWQNKILTAIALLGLLALVESWASYLALLEKDYDAAMSTSLISCFFADANALMMFNTWFPPIVLVVCVIAFVLVFVQRRR